MATLTHPTIMRALDWAWARAAKGLPGQDSAEELASRHRDPSVPLETRLTAIMKSHRRQAAAAGFLTNVGGLALLPAALPANLAGTLFIQLRMVQAMALVCGHDLSDNRVRALCGLCLCGSKAAEVAGAAGAKFGVKITERFLAELSTQMAARLNRLVGSRLLARLGERGVLGAGGRLVPVVGGLIGAACDGAATAGIGKAAMALLAATAAGEEESGRRPEPRRGE